MAPDRRVAYRGHNEGFLVFFNALYQTLHQALLALNRVLLILNKLLSILFRNTVRGGETNPKQLTASTASTSLLFNIVPRVGVER